MLSLVILTGFALFTVGAAAEPSGLLAAAIPAVDRTLSPLPSVTLSPAPLPAAPLPALVAALRRPIGTPAFPFGQQHPGTQAVYFLLRTKSAGELRALQDTLHREPVWLRQLTDEIRRQGFDPRSAATEAEGGKLLWQIVPFQYPPLREAKASTTKNTTSTSFYDPVTGAVDVAAQAPRWPRSISLIHEAMHAMQSEPGAVSFALLRATPWSAQTWVYSATREHPAALEAAVECGPSLLSGLAIAELYHRVLPRGPAIRTALATPGGREFNTEWLLRQAHRHGIFGDTATARALGYRHDRPRGINDLLGRTSAGRQFVEQFLPSR